MTTLLLWSLRALAVVVLGGLLALALRHRSAALRNLVYRITLVAALALPVLGLFAPKVPVELPTPVRVAAPASPAQATPVQSEKIAEAPWPQTVVHEQSGPTDTSLVQYTPYSTTGIPIGLIVVPLYTSGILVFLCRWGLGLYRLRRLLRNSKPMDGEPSTRLGETAVPVTFGKTILLPANALDWPDSRRRAAILHERAHIWRGDWAWQTLASLFVAIHWFNPAAWLLARGLRDSAEVAADDEVLAAGFSPSAYARELLEVAKSAGSIGPALAMARRGGVRDRIVDVLATHRDRRRPNATVRVTLLATILGFGLLLAGLVTAEQKTEADLPGGPKIQIASLSVFGAGTCPTWTSQGTPLPPNLFDGAGAKRKGGVVLVPGQTTANLAMKVLLTGPGHENATLKLLSLAQQPIRWKEPSAGETDWWFAWHRSGDASTGKVRIGVASGDWIPFPAGAVSHKVNEGRINRHATVPPSANVAFSVPRLFAGREVRVRALDRKGKTLSQQTFDIEPASPDRTYDGTSIVYLYRVDRKNIDRIAFETREFKPVEFPNVALRPSPSAQVKAARVAPSGIELAWIAEGDRVWRRDGTLDKAIRAPKLALATNPGWRRIAFGFRMPDGNSGVWSIRSTVWGKYAYPSDHLTTEPLYGGKPGQLLAWCSVQLRPDVKTAKIGTDIYMPDWRTDVDTVPGDGPGEARISKGGVVQSGPRTLQQVNVSLPGVDLPTRDRNVELRVFSSGSQPLNILSPAVPWGPDNSYTVYMPPAESVRRVVLRSCAIEHLRFDDVSLWPK